MRKEAKYLLLDNMMPLKMHTTDDESNDGQSNDNAHKGCWVDDNQIIFEMEKVRVHQRHHGPWQSFWIYDYDCIWYMSNTTKSLIDKII